MSSLHADLTVAHPPPEALLQPVLREETFQRVDVVRIGAILRNGSTVSAPPAAPHAAPHAADAGASFATTRQLDDLRVELLAAIKDSANAQNGLLREQIGTVCRNQVILDVVGGKVDVMGGGFTNIADSIAAMSRSVAMLGSPRGRQELRREALLQQPPPQVAVGQGQQPPPQHAAAPAAAGGRVHQFQFPVTPEDLYFGEGGPGYHLRRRHQQ
jgi:hypothetical protein